MTVLPEDFTLETDRCRLRAPSEDDFPFIFEASHTPGFNDGMPWDPPATFEEMRGPLERGRKGWQEGTAYNFSIETRSDRVFVGRVSIRRSEEDSVWDIGFWIRPSHQRLGYATETAKAILQFGFGVLDAEAIEACYADWNEASGRVLRSIGMNRVGFLEQGFQKNGEWVAEVLMRCDRPKSHLGG